MREFYRLVKWLALGAATVAFVGVLQYAWAHPESEHPPLVPSVVFIASMFVAGVARHLQDRMVPR